MVVGAGLGIQTRTQNWLGSDLSSEIQKWEEADIERERVAERLFENSYPAHPTFSEGLAISETLAAHIQMWTAWGIEQQVVTEKLFDQYYDDQQARSAIPFEGDAAESNILHAKTIKDCDALLSMIDPAEGESFTADESRAFLNNVISTDFHVLLDLSDDADAIAKVLRVLCKIN